MAVCLGTRKNTTFSVLLCSGTKQVTFLMSLHLGTKKKRYGSANLGLTLLAPTKRPLRTTVWGTQTHKHTYIHTHIHTYIHAYIQTYIRAYARMHISTHVSTYIHTCMHTHIHTCICTYIHTCMENMYYVALRYVTIDRNTY